MRLPKRTEQDTSGGSKTRTTEQEIRSLDRFLKWLTGNCLPSVSIRNSVVPKAWIREICVPDDLLQAAYPPHTSHTHSRPDSICVGGLWLELNVGGSL